MKKAFITGGAGFIGSRIAKRFIDEGYEVYVFDTFKHYMKPDPNEKSHNLLIRLHDFYDRLTLVQGDTLNKDFLRRTLNKIKPDVIVHMAALPLATVAIEQTEDCFESILNSTVNIMEIMRDFSHACSLVYASSSMVYGNFENESVIESDRKDPKDIYGSIKLAGEIIVRGYVKRYGLDAKIVRPTAVYGPFDANQRVMYKFITNALAGKKVTVDGDGGFRLDFTFVDDTANGIFLAAITPNVAGEAFNIARGNARSLKELVEIVSEHIPNIEVEYGPPPAHVPKRGTLDITKAKNMLGFSPQYDLEDKVSQYVDHLRKNQI